MFDRNYACFMERFPQLALEMPASRPKKTAREPLLSMPLKAAEALYFYGIGQGEGYFCAKEWLQQDASRRLIFLEDDLKAISLFLHCVEAEQILANPQVVFAKRSEIDSLVETFPFRWIEVASLPSVGKRRIAGLKEELLRKTALAHALHIDRLHGYQPFHNFVSNLRHLPRSFYANRLQGRFKGIPAIVLGAGPSLQSAIPALRTLGDKALLIAGGSTLAALSSQGILPHFGIAVDPNLEEYRRLKNSFAFEVPLLYSTRVFPSVFQTMNGPFGYMRSGIGGVPELWIEEELGLLDPLIGTHLSSDSISVTTICLAWAQFLGCNPIVLSGVDLAYTNGRRYASGVLDTEEEASEQEHGAADRTVKRKDRLGKPVLTAIRWLMESAAFSHFAAMHPETTFLNTTEGGIGFKKIPYHSLQKAVVQFFNNSFPLRQKVQEEITLAQMPSDAYEIITHKMRELTDSLDRIIGHLEVCSGVQKGSVAISEIEMLEEMAYPYLFYDAPLLFEKGLNPHLSAKEKTQEKWKKFLEHAKRYRLVLKNKDLSF